ncbi:MAG TPA: zinc-binding dehydrogenase [Gemmatimonadaceae bacterium]|nr:zinc-binding dehydrogenase [Gemmatimonadaceae bacterium]
MLRGHRVRSCWGIASIALRFQVVNHGCGHRLADALRLRSSDSRPDRTHCRGRRQCWCYALQLASQAGLHVIAVVGAANRQYLTMLGAERVVDYKTERVEESLTGVDIVLDTVVGEMLGGVPHRHGKIVLSMA